MVEAEFCIPFPVAASIIGIEPGPKWFSKQSLNNKSILRLAEKIEMIADSEADSIWAASLRANPPLWDLPAAATVYTARGTYTAEVRTLRGDPNNPLTDDELKRKFRGLAKHVLDKERASRIIESVEKLERISVRRLTRLLRSS
jgi:2-methylcitrate dehydratase PrpD